VLYIKTKIKIENSSVIKEVSVIKVQRKSPKKAGGIGSIITAVVTKNNKNKIKKGSIVILIATATKKQTNINRVKTGIYYKITKNAGVILSKNNEIQINKNTTVISYFLIQTGKLKESFIAKTFI